MWARERHRSRLASSAVRKLSSHSIRATTGDLLVPRLHQLVAYQPWLSGSKRLSVLSRQSRRLSSRLRGSSGAGAGPWVSRYHFIAASVLLPGAQNSSAEVCNHTSGPV